MDEINNDIQEIHDRIDKLHSAYNMRGILILFMLVLLIIYGVKISKLNKQIVALQDEVSSIEYEEQVTPQPQTINIEKVEINQIYQEPQVEEVVVDETELDMLSRLISAEAGANYCTYDLMLYTGSVVLNRIEHESFPDDMKSVIYQQGQYACVNNGSFYKEPTERACQAAQELLEGGSVLPSNVVFQAQFQQGDGVYIKEQNMYFCYKE